MSVARSIADEHAEQVALFRWWKLYSRKLGIQENLLFAIPNGGRRDAVTGARLKAEGVRAGVPDLMFALRRLPWGGLFIELKRRQGGRVSQAQKDMCQNLADAGYAIAICHGWQEAQMEIQRYILGSFAQSRRYGHENDE